MKLKDLGDYYIGLTYKPEDVSEDGIIVLRSGNIQDGQFDLSDIVRVNAKIREKLFVRPGDIIMCSRNGSARLVGKSTVVPDINEPMTFGAFMTVFRTPYNDYIKYFFQSNCFRRQLLSSKTTTINQITIGMLDRIDIDLPNHTEREVRTNKLEILQRIIQFRKQELLRLDELIKARFIEMFGDPVINPKGYPIIPISDLFDVGSSKRVFESEWRESGVPFYRAREIVKLSREGFVKNELFIEENLYEKYKSKYGVPRAGDMMVTGVGTLGVCYIVQPHDHFYFKDGNTLWFKNKGKCSVRFIREQFDMDFVRRQIEANANVSTVGTYTITNANNTLVLLPSIEEQSVFDSFVSQIDKSKSAVQKALDEAQLLFDSLMQQYFG